MDSLGSSNTLCEAAKEILNRSLTNRLQNARLGHLAVEITMMTRAWCLVDVPVVPAVHPVRATKNSAPVQTQVPRLLLQGLRQIRTGPLPFAVI